MYRSTIWDLQAAFKDFVIKRSDIHKYETRQAIAN